LGGLLVDKSLLELAWFATLHKAGKGRD